MSGATEKPAASGAETGWEVLLTGRYLRLLLLSAVLGLPVGLACFFFVSAQHELQNQVWQNLPEALGYDGPPWWWPLPALLLAGLILAPVVTRMPGAGGHVPADGLGGPPIGPRELPSVILAALATLPLGVVLGPEAPLMALGSGLALLILRLARAAGDQRSMTVVATTGSTAAISTILGGPVVAALFVLEAAGLAGPRVAMLLLPCMTASGTGALVFTGFGHWTGLSIGALSLTTVPPDATPDAGDFLWGLPAAVLVALVITTAHRLGRFTVRWTAHSKSVRTVLCAVAVGCCIAAYALITGRSPEEAALSGQAELGAIAADPHAWSVGALVALVVCKGLAWGICLGSLRGGPIFPSVLLGVATAMACSGLPGFGVTPALGLGIAASAVAVTGLPLTSAVLAVLLLGDDAYEQMPLIVMASVVSFLTARLVLRWWKREPKGQRTADA
ncbi:chloride channel protein [Streptomyces fructofermentans]|uniref:Chloride channel protein n=1 Tax=Streptomyces fructofermentans TaxID=152141 RepID=A0A918NP55_9ACTN|nr:chloride channel protein [Streptomyces fructofermentans]GGX84802.1 hypothetical protein GCM10010515_60270 [Streptomyces fructofermentans]